MRREHPPLRLAFVGCGRVVEQCHLPVLRTLPGVELVAVVDTDLVVADNVAARHSVQRRCRDYREVLSDPKIDAVAVCTPPQFHAEIGLAVLDADKHLFMEKPLALSLNDADRLVARAAAAPGKALMAFNLRWHRLVREARHAVDAGRLGELEMINTTFTSKTGFRTAKSDWRHRHELGGSVLFDLGIHHFDLWRFLTRSEIGEVFAHYRPVDQGVELATVCSLMKNGMLVTSTFAHGLSDTNEVEIRGRKARLQMSCYRFDSLRISDNAAVGSARRDWVGGIIGTLRAIPQAAQLRRGGDMIGSYRAEWQHFADVIWNDATVECTFEDARSAVQVALAAVESASCGRPIEVAQAARVIAPISPPAPVLRTSG